MIEVSGLHRSFGDVVAVDDVSFHAPDGQITGLLGPNGAGKTTTLRALYGILRPDAGSAHIDDVDVLRDPREGQRRLGVLPDSRGLYLRLTAREHIEYAGQLYGMKRAALRARIEVLSQALDMSSILDRRVKGFSMGERTKVAIARALIHNPRNIILDEPTNGLDVMTTRSMREVIRDLKAEGKCVLFSSHIMQEVSALCDRVVVIAHGKVAAEGSPQELCARAGEASLEEAFVKLIGSAEGLE